MKTEILNFINQTTSQERLFEKSTKEVAMYFGIPTSEAFKLLSQLSNDGLIEKYAPVNGDKFDCCGWIRITDNQ